jgi:hypothetical protein
MKARTYKKTVLMRSTWLALAMFFIIFSCPVKKYFRLQLYKQTHAKVVETGGDQYGIKEIKDCSIADKHDNQLVVPSVVYIQPLQPSPRFASIDPYFLPVFISLAVMYIPRRRKRAVGLALAPVHPDELPLYIRMQHFRI